MTGHICCPPQLRKLRGPVEAVAHAMGADVHQELITADGLVKPVNAIAQPMAAPDDEVSVVLMSWRMGVVVAAKAAGVVPTSHW